MSHQTAVGRRCCSCSSPIELEKDENDEDFLNTFGVRCWHCAHFFCHTCCKAHFREWKKWIFLAAGFALGIAASFLWRMT